MLVMDVESVDGCAADADDKDGRGARYNGPPQSNG